jgi:hypothetical protein
MYEFQTIELAFQFSNLSYVSIHLLVVAIPVFIDLVDEQSGVAIE